MIANLAGVALLALDALRAPALLAGDLAARHILRP